MRLQVVLTSDTDVLIPWNYSYLLHGFLYQAITRSEPELGFFLHEEGFQAGNRRYKMLLFSRLFPKSAKPVDTGLIMSPPIRWWVSSPLSGPIEALAKTMLTEMEVSIGQTRMYVERIELEPQPKFEGRLLCETISPIIASTGVQRGEKLHKKFLSPNDDNFWKVIESNLFGKANSLGIELSPGARVRFECIGAWRSRLWMSQNTQVRGYEGRFYMEGNETLLQLAYDAGLGERNSQGFGMFRVLRSAQDGGGKLV